MKRQTNLKLVPGDFNILKQLEFKLDKKIWIQKPAGKVRKIIYLVTYSSWWSRWFRSFDQFHLIFTWWTLFFIATINQSFFGITNPTFEKFEPKIPSPAFSSKWGHFINHAFGHSIYVKTVNQSVLTKNPFKLSKSLDAAFVNICNFDSKLL